VGLDGKGHIRYFGRPAYKNIVDLKEAVFDSWARIPDHLCLVGQVSG
jgi:hypothetical protein